MPTQVMRRRNVVQNGARSAVAMLIESDVAPTVNDDVNKNIVRGCEWYVINEDGIEVARFYCEDASAGAAVWAWCSRDARTVLREEDPTSGDNIEYGFEAGDRWMNTSTRQEFVCYDASGSAVWLSAGAAGGGGGGSIVHVRDSAPTADDDTTEDISVNDLYYNTATGFMYVARDVTEGSASYNQVAASQAVYARTYQHVDEDPNEDVGIVYGIAVGDGWLRQDTQRLWICKANDFGSASWQMVANKTFNRDSGPTASDDRTLGYYAGDQWIHIEDEDTSHVYLCRDDEAGNAYWFSTFSTNPPAGVGVPVGTIIMYPHADIGPSGYLRCDGTQYASATYPQLAEVCGAAYDNDPALPSPDAGNFRVPLFMDANPPRFPVAYASGVGFTMGQTGGSLSQEIPQFSGSLLDGTGICGEISGSCGFSESGASAGGDFNAAVSPIDFAGAAGLVSGVSGSVALAGGQTLTHVPPYLVVAFWIKHD